MALRWGSGVNANPPEIKRSGLPNNEATMGDRFDIKIAEDGIPTRLVFPLIGDPLAIQ